MRAGNYSATVTLRGRVRNGGLTQTIEKTFRTVVTLSDDMPRNQLENNLIDQAEVAMRIDRNYKTDGIVVLFLSIEPE